MSGRSIILALGLTLLAASADAQPRPAAPAPPPPEDGDRMRWRPPHPGTRRAHALHTQDSADAARGARPPSRSRLAALRPGGAPVHHPGAAQPRRRAWPQPHRSGQCSTTSSTAHAGNSSRPCPSWPDCAPGLRPGRVLAAPRRRGKRVGARRHRAIARAAIQPALELSNPLVLARNPLLEAAGSAHPYAAGPPPQPRGPDRRSPAASARSTHRHSDVELSMPSDHYGYSGRSHALWFCDAQEAGSYAWFETAFMLQPLMAQQSNRDPFSLKPGAEAGEAVGPGMNAYQVAWPFAKLDHDSLEDFINRWAGWFADAADGRLHRPNTMPEGNPKGSWRQA